MNNHEIPDPSPEEVGDVLNKIEISTAESEENSLTDLEVRRDNLLLYAGTNAWGPADRELLENLNAEIKRRKEASTHTPSA